MPTYEYRCTACGHEFEAFQSIKADPIRVCPACRKAKVERKIGIGGAVIFKGGGFYETDYRSESYAKGAEAERKAQSDGASPGAAPADAAKSAPAPSTGAGSEGSGGKPTSGPGSKGTTTPAAESGRSGSEPAGGSGASSKEPPSKATHPSRVGRGAGNIIQNPPKPKPASSPTRGSSKSSKPTKRPR